jgi:hypothetical protein
VIVVKLLRGGRGQVVEVLVGTDGVEEVDPLECGDLDGVDVAPGAVAVDLLGLERADRGLGQRVEAPMSSGGAQGVDLA